MADKKPLCLYEDTLKELQAGDTLSPVSDHEAALDPHPGYALESSLGTAAGQNVESLILRVDSISALRAVSGRFLNDAAFVLGYSLPGDGGGGPIRAWKDSGVAGTYVDNGGSIIVPTGGDGSAAWLWEYSGPINVKWFGAKGDGLTDDQAALVAALASGGKRFLFADGTYLQTADLTVPAEVSIAAEGGATLKAADANSITTAMLVVSSGVTLRGLRLDGNSANNTTGIYSGISGTHTSRVVIEGCYILATPKNGILLWATTTPNVDFGIVNNVVTDVGWRGIEVVYAFAGNIVGNKVISSGSNGIGVEPGSDPTLHPCKNVVIRDNYINREASPPVILTGQTESGFMIGIGAASEQITVSGNVCWDNRNAGDDGIGLGEDPATAQTRIVITGNIVHLAGQFGIDATNGAIVSGNIVSSPASHGIVLASDLGEDMSFVTIADNLVLNPNEGASGTISGIYVGSLVAGTVMDYISISNNTVVDGRTPKQTAYGITLDPTNVVFGSAIRLMGNEVSQVATQGFNPSGAGIVGLVAVDNVGAPTSTSSQIQVPNRTTSVTVNHGLILTPALEDIRLTALTPEAASSPAWISDVTSTQFKINLTSAAGASTYYGWAAEAGQP